MPQLRALYLLHISHSLHRDLKEVALQVLDIVSIRPELRITYIGLETKCYRILEASSNGHDPDFDQPNGHSTASGYNSSAFDGDPMDDTDEDDEAPDPPDQDPDLLSSDLSDDYDTEPEDNASRVRFRLQEILFYDDKISIFKARHGVL